MPALKTKMVIATSPANPQIKKTVGFVVVNDIVVPVASALSDLERAGEICREKMLAPCVGGRHEALMAEALWQEGKQRDKAAGLAIKAREHLKNGGAFYAQDLKRLNEAVD